MMTTKLFVARGAPGIQLDATDEAPLRKVRKRPLRVTVRFAQVPIRLTTPEGTINVSARDAILKDGWGREWAVDRARFEAKYEPIPPTLSGDVGAYMSLPVEALAVQMSQPFRVRFADGVSELEGRPGDWLLDYQDGSLGIVAADAFQNSYDLV
jgi:hypothetical protein